MPHRRVLSLILMLSLAARLAWGLMQPGEIDQRLPDQQQYLELARNVLSGRGLKFYDVHFSQEVVAFRAPGYPLFLAACAGSVRAARVVQGLLDTSTVLAAYLLARRWMGRGAGLLAAAAVAANPFLVYFSALILSETLFTAMLVWGMVLLVWRRNFLWGGLLLSLSVLVRPGAVALPVAMGFAAVFVTYPYGESPPRRWWRMPVGTSMLLLTLLVLLPWGVRNKAVLDRWVWLTTNGGITRYDGFNPESTGASDQTFLESDVEMRRLSRMTELQRDDYLAERANDWIARTWRRDRSALARLTVAKVARTWSPLPLSSDFGRPLYQAVAAIYAIPLFLLAVLGLWAGRLPRRGKVFLLMPAVYLTIVHAASVGSLRYRVPAEPALAVLAAAGAVAGLEMLKRPGWRRQ
jgi:4-amino-4-deoxy-L-arabinose transferase-like glycosyltransferase